MPGSPGSHGLSQSRRARGPGLSPGPPPGDTRCRPRGLAAPRPRPGAAPSTDRPAGSRGCSAWQLAGAPPGPPSEDRESGDPARPVRVVELVDLGVVEVVPVVEVELVTVDLDPETRAGRKLEGAVAVDPRDRDDVVDLVVVMAVDRVAEVGHRAGEMDHRRGGDA